MNTEPLIKVAQGIAMLVDDLGQTIDDSLAITAHGERDAVNEWAADFDRQFPQMPIASGNDRIVIVRNLNHGIEREWIARGEYLPQYQAQLVVSA